MGGFLGELLASDVVAVAVAVAVALSFVQLVSAAVRVLVTPTVYALVRSPAQSAPIAVNGLIANDLVPDALSFLVIAAVACLYIWIRLRLSNGEPERSVAHRPRVRRRNRRPPG